MEPRPERCATCRYFCQDVDPESRLYFDPKSGECRKNPPIDHYVWQKTRPYHWCGQWQSKDEGRALVWRPLKTHAFDERPVLLYGKSLQCKHTTMMVGYWNSAYAKWHDDGDRLFDREEFTHWMDLPSPPSS